ncbi:MAG: FHA domain-containing protein [Chitinispirillaceae bacterium]|nr:FHA domain-containing protein [Chitinispirillaceae bacterium]
MAGLIIEILGRSSDRSVFHKVSRFPLSVGRAPENDLIVADPYVSPRHLSVEECGEGWLVVDQGSTNGVLFGKGRRINAPVEVRSGDSVLIGRTTLRFLSPTQEVVPALPLPAKQGAGTRVGIPLIAFVTIMMTFSFVTANRYLHSVTEIKPIALFAESLPLLFFPLLWAGVWALSGFIVKRRGDFSLQLIVANAAFILFSLFTTLAEYVDYFTSSLVLSNSTQYVCMGLLSTTLLFLNLKIATGTAGLRRVMVALSIGGGIVILIAVSNHAENAENGMMPQYSRTLKPPYARIASTVTIEQFFDHGKKLFGEQKTKESKKTADP